MCISSKKKLINWLLLPFNIMVLIAASCVVSCVNDLIENKMRVIKKMWKAVFNEL